MPRISDRLAKVRRDSGLGIRPFADLISQSGYDVSHGSVAAYENPDGATVPAEYVAVVARVFKKNAAWLLYGEPWSEDYMPPGEAERRLEAVREALNPPMQKMPLESFKPLPEPASQPDEEEPDRPHSA